jgi:DNA modification methylase
MRFHRTSPGYRQLQLVGMELDNGRSTFADPAFSGNKSLPIHRWVPWIAGFSSDFVASALAKYLNGPGIILDPFAGVGTTLVEAVLQGHDAIGFEINPYAALAGELKANAHRVDVAALRGEIPRFQTFYQAALSTGCVPHSSYPNGFRTRAAFYSPKVLHKVLLVWDFIETVQDVHTRDLFRLAFGSTMVRYSNYSYEPSLGRRASAGKGEIDDFPVDKAIMAKLREMAEDIAWFKDTLPANTEPSVRIICDSFFQYREYLVPKSVDLIITSPPYLNNYHYIRNTRPQLYWLGYAQHPKDLKELEHSNFGKCWQTVRAGVSVRLEFSLPNTDLSDRLDMLRRTNPGKGVYGGEGWANYAASYFNDCYKFALGIQYVLKPGGTALVVIGNSILQGIFIPTDQYFAKIAESVGLELVSIEIPRAARVGNSIIRSNVRVARAGDKQRLYEAVVEVRKPS